MNLIGNISRVFLALTVIFAPAVIYWKVDSLAAGYVLVVAIASLWAFLIWKSRQATRHFFTLAIYVFAIAIISLPICLAFHRRQLDAKTNYEKLSLATKARGVALTHLPSNAPLNREEAVEFRIIVDRDSGKRFLTRRTAFPDETILTVDENGVVSFISLPNFSRRFPNSGSEGG